jgi:fibronectin type 3 domain-containing protein
MKSHALQWVKPQPTPKQRRNRRQAAPSLEYLEDRLVPAIINVNSSNYLSLVGTAQPGDTVEFAAGNYSQGLNLSGMNGTAGAWITFDGSAGATILGTASQNTVELDNTSYLVFENFTVDSQHLNDGIKAGGGLSNVSHDIVIKNNSIINADSSQQTVGISTKCIAWNWTIQGNTINGAGTGMYLGDSSGYAPFINGVIQNNTVENTIGYGIEIKDQEPYALVSGMPSSGTTILRNNEFLNNDIQGALGQGARPNVMIGGFPASGPGSTDTYQIYGNLIDNNVSSGDYLMQVTGRATIHDNNLINDSVGGLNIQPHYDDSGTLFSPQQISVYDNTIYDVGTGISGASSWPVVGNLIFANNSGAPAGNISDSIANAGLYLTAPTTAPVAANFVPLAGKAQGAAVNLSQFGSDLAYNVDYGGNARPSSDTTYGAFEGSGTVVQPPAAPSGLNATAGDGQVSLSWTGSAGAASYNVYRWNGSSYGLLQNVGGTSFTDTGLTDGTTYWYEVTAVNSGGESGPSNQVSATPQAVVTAPAPPTSLSATAGDGQVALSWSGSAGATSYNVYRWNGSSYGLLQNVGGTFFTDADLADGSTYWYEVTAVNSGGESGPSNQVSATPQAALTYGLSASPTSAAPGATVTVNWTAPAGHSTSDWIGLFAVGSPNSSYLAYQYTTSATSGAVSFTAPATPGSYEFRFLPNNGYTSVASSNALQVQAAVTVPPAPTSLAATAGDGQVALSWSASTGADSYNVYRWNGSGYGFLQNVGSTSLTDSGLSDGTTYYYEVTAVSSAGESGASNQVSATPQAAVTYSVSASPSTAAPGGTITVNWTAPAGHSASDWIGLFTVGSANTSYLAYQYTTAETGGSVAFTAPSTAGSYEFRYLPNDGYTSVAVSNAVQVQTPVPAAPINLTATAGSAKVALSWSPSDGATGYNIYRGTASGGETLIKSGVTGTSFTNTNLTNGKTYFYEVTAVNSAGQSALSTEVSAKPHGLPVITKLSTTAGPTKGGNKITIYGSGLSGATGVYFGGVAATSFAVNSDSAITVVVPAHAAGTVDVTVVTALGTSALTTADHYTFVSRPVMASVSPNSGPTAGGTVVTISGQNLTGATKVLFGKYAATSFVVNADGTLTAWAPAEAAGTINIYVVSAGGSSATTTADRFRYF